MKLTEITPFASGLTCPRCTSTKIVKNGRFKHRQNYLCKNCGKAMSTNTGTAISGIHKPELFVQYAQCIEDGLTIRQAAKQIGISVSTSFAWRHKYLSALKPPKAETFHKIKSLAIIRTPYSEKGNKRACKQPNTKPSYSIMCSDVAGNTSTIKFTNTKELDKTLYSLTRTQGTSIFKPYNLLTRSRNRISISTNTSRSIIKEHKKLTEKVETELNIWLSKFRGVATKYLQQYWNWHSTKLKKTELQWSIVTDLSARQNYLHLSN